MKNKDLLIISHLRNNARLPMTKMSKKTNIPVSTIFDKLKEYDKQVINKHTCLLNFKELGYDVKAHILFKVEKDQRDSFQSFLTTHQSVNNVFRINNGFDYLVEGIFKNLQDLNEFFESSDERGSLERQEYFILSDIAREKFLNHQPGFEIMKDFR